MSRLAPMPTDTALARFVGRLVARWPLVARSTHESEIRTRDMEISRLRAELFRRHSEVLELRQGYESLMNDLRPPILPVTMTAMRDDTRMATRIRVDFQPVFYMLPDRDRIQNRYPAAAEAMKEQIAGEMAHHHAREVRAAILARLKHMREGVAR